MATSSNQIVQWLYELKETVKSNLPPVDISEDEIRWILRKYDAAIRPNFIPWMTVGLIRHANILRIAEGAPPRLLPFAVTQRVGPKALKAVLLNLIDELKVSETQYTAHPIMLFDFVAQVDCIATPDDFKAVDSSVRRMYEGIGRAKDKELGPVMPAYVVAAALELTSQEFVPRLAEWVTKLKPDADLRYTDIHGEADEMHTQLLLDAVRQTDDLNPDDIFKRSQVEDAIGSVGLLLSNIFHI